MAMCFDPRDRISSVDSRQSRHMESDYRLKSEKTLHSVLNMETGGAPATLGGLEHRSLSDCQIE